MAKRVSLALCVFNAVKIKRNCDERRRVAEAQVVWGAPLLGLVFAPHSVCLCGLQVASGSEAPPSAILPSGKEVIVCCLVAASPWQLAEGGSGHPEELTPSIRQLQNSQLREEAALAVSPSESLLDAGCLPCGVSEGQASDGTRTLQGGHLAGQTDLLPSWG